jgi:hypothetical protein
MSEIADLIADNVSLKEEIKSLREQLHFVITNYAPPKVLLSEKAAERRRAFERAAEIAREYQDGWHTMTGNPCKRIADRILAEIDQPPTPPADVAYNVAHSTEYSEKLIKIQTLEHTDGGLFMAISDDLEGFLLGGHSAEELERKLPGAIRDFLEFSGYVVGPIELVRNQKLADTHFGPPAFIAHASVACNEPA